MNFASSVYDNKAHALRIWLRMEDYSFIDIEVIF